MPSTLRYKLPPYLQCGTYNVNKVPCGEKCMPEAEWNDSYQRPHPLNIIHVVGIRYLKDHSVEDHR